MIKSFWLINFYAVNIQKIGQQNERILKRLKNNRKLIEKQGVEPYICGMLK